jgi:hypothetical protein
MHHTKDKGNLATIKAMADLTEKGFDIFTPVVSEHLPFDFITYKDGRFLKFQSKYMKCTTLPAKTSWSDKNGTHYKYYKDTDFDYYAAYIADKDIICYPSIKFRGCTLTTEIPNSASPFYWYEDFLDLTDNAKKKTYKDFNVKITRSNEPKIKHRKVERPSKDELNSMIWTYPITYIAAIFDVSDVAVHKWIRSYGLNKPPRGHWLIK